MKTNNTTLGACFCGCGERTNLATQNNILKGHVKGQPVRFIQGHSLKIGRTKVTDGYATCSSCKLSKPISEYRPRRDKPCGIRSNCRECESNIATQKRFEGIDISILRHRIKQCAICGTQERIVIDHNHQTKLVRDYLCRLCNLGLGNFQENIDLLKKAISYLESHEAT